MEVLGPSATEFTPLPPDEVLKPAWPADVKDVTELMRQAAAFKRQQGDQLWGDQPFTEDEVASMIERGNLFVFKIDGVAAASVVLAPSDVRIWGPDDGADGSALYIHRLCVGDAFRGIGTRVMTAAEDYALNNGKTKLRLDCPYDNPGLCTYYENFGFEEMRREDRPNSAGGRNPDQDVYRAALYEKEIMNGGDS
ncbi:MAG: hypothetical protein JWM37_72 [Candidatus Saccharibacteria bacterium]|nr:hypothetical protein [Candidatus Saccharibacteria bacterium]